MNPPNPTPVRVPVEDKMTRGRAAVAVAKAWTRHPLYWLSLAVFTGFGGYVAQVAWETLHENELFGAGWTTSLVLFALACVAVGVFFVPLSLAHTIYRAVDLYYLDTGAARAAMATKPDNRRDALRGDVQGHSFGSWPPGTKVGRTLGKWVRADVHASGGRLTGTALPGMAKTYIKHGMIDDGRIVGILVRVASTTRPEETDDQAPTGDCRCARTDSEPAPDRTTRNQEITS